MKERKEGRKEGTCAEERTGKVGKNVREGGKEARKEGTCVKEGNKF